jgi:pimeloyl-ACP methyl ester carboxylesterase
MSFRARLVALVASIASLAVPLAPAAAADTLGTALPQGFPTITDASLGVPVLGFGAPGPVSRTPVIFLHGNNDTPFPTACNPLYGEVHAFAESFLARGYEPSELWGLGYQGAQCDLGANPTNRSGEAHSTVANVPDLRRFVHAVLTYTGAKQVDIVGHSLGGTLARAWLQEDSAWHLVRRLVSIASPHHGIITCGPLALGNYFALPAAGGFTPDSAICQEYGAADTPFLQWLNRGSETLGGVRHLAIRNGDADFVYISAPDGPFFPAIPSIDRNGALHDFSASPALRGATNVVLTGQGAFDILGSAHLGIANSPTVWDLAADFLLEPLPGRNDGSD